MDEVLRALMAIASTDRLFNPYRDHDPAVEAAGAPEMRRCNLRVYLEAMPTVAEIAATMPALHALIAWKRPSRILCIGRVAERAAQGLRVRATYVRHPAQGGSAAFREGVASFIEQGD